MGSYKLISADDHVSEPVDLWTSRIRLEFKERAPHIVRLDDGSDWWYTDGMKGVPVGAEAQAGVRFDDIDKLSQQGRVEDSPAGAYDPHARVVDMDLDGIHASVIYPNQGLLLYSVPDTKLVHMLLKIYNDWLAEYCQTYPNRLIGIAMILLDDMEWGIRELKRCHKLGYTGAMIPVCPTPDRPYHLPEYEPFWKAAEDLGMALSLHIGTHRQGKVAALTDFEKVTPDYFCNTDFWVRQSICQMIMGGVFERHPNLQVGSIENEAAWGAFLKVNMDYTYTQRNQLPHWHRYNENMLPSDYFSRNIFLGFQEDALGIQLREHIGINTLQWGSDYPHIESTFPRSQEILEEILADCTDYEKSQIVSANASRVYHIS